MLAQIIGAFAAIAIIGSFWFKEKKKLFLTQIISNLLYSIQYYLMSANTGLFSSVIAIIRSIIFAKKEEGKQNKIYNYITLILVLIYMIALKMTWNGIISIFPILAETINTVFMNFFKLKGIRIINIIISVLWLVYNIYIVSYAGITVNILFVISTTVALIKYDIMNKK